MTPRRRILIAEDDARTAALLSELLRDQGYDTLVVMSGLHVEPEVRRCEPSLVLLDVGLPHLDGLEVCRNLRRFSSVPIIMLSGRDEEIDRALGLELGADDYMGKPFGTREIVARVKAQLRRTEGRLVGGVSPDGFRIDEAGRRIGWRDDWLRLTPQEYRVLRKLLSHPGQLFTREELLDEGDDSRSASARAVDSHVKNLRRKIASVRPEGSAAIASIYGMGYRFEVKRDSSN